METVILETAPVMPVDVMEGRNALRNDERPIDEQPVNQQEKDKQWLTEQARSASDCLQHIKALQQERGAAQYRLSVVLRDVKERMPNELPAFCKKLHLKPRTVEVYLQVNEHTLAEQLFCTVGLGKAAVLCALSEKQVKQVLKKPRIDQTTIDELREDVGEMLGRPKRRPSVPAAKGTKTAEAVDSDGPTDVEIAYALGAHFLAVNTTDRELIERQHRKLSALLSQGSKYQSFFDTLQEAKDVLDRAFPNDQDCGVPAMTEA